MKKLFLFFISFILLITFFTSPASATTTRINSKPIQDYIKKHKGIVGVYYQNIETKNTYQYQTTKVTRAASTIKLPLVTYIMEQASKKKIDLNKKLTYHSYEYNGGSGIFNMIKLEQNIPSEHLLNMPSSIVTISHLLCYATMLANLNSLHIASLLAESIYTKME